MVSRKRWPHCDRGSPTTVMEGLLKQNHPVALVLAILLSLDKMPDTLNLKKEIFILAYDFTLWSSDSKAEMA